MPLNIEPDFANWIIRIRNTGGGISSNNTIAIGTHNVAPLDQTSVARVANLMRDALKTLYDAAWELGPIHVVEGDSPVNRIWDDTIVEPGTHAADVYAPPNVATIVSKQTGLAGKSLRGRFYLPGVPQGFVGEGGGINPTHVTAVQTAVDLLKSTVIADAAVDYLALFHDEPSSPQVTPHQIDNFLVRTVAGTMRPRLRRV